MAEIEKAIEEEVVTPDSEEVDIELEGEEPTTVEEAVMRLKNFLKILQKTCLMMFCKECLINY